MWQRSRPTLAVSASARETTRQGRKMPTGSSITPEAFPKNPAHLLEHAIAIEAKLQKKGIWQLPWHGHIAPALPEGVVRAQEGWRGGNTEGDGAEGEGQSGQSGLFGQSRCHLS